MMAVDDGVGLGDAAGPGLGVHAGRQRMDGPVDVDTGILPSPGGRLAVGGVVLAAVAVLAAEGHAEEVPAQGPKHLGIQRSTLVLPGADIVGLYGVIRVGLEGHRGHVPAEARDGQADGAILQRPRFLPGDGFGSGCHELLLSGSQNARSTVWRQGLRDRPVRAAYNKAHRGDGVYREQTAE